MILVRVKLVLEPCKFGANDKYNKTFKNAKHIRK